MQPKVIKNFLSKETCNLINEHVKLKVRQHPVDEAHPNGKNDFGIFHKEEPVYFNHYDLNKKDSNVNLVFDILNLSTSSISALFNLPKKEIKTQSVNYTLFKTGQGLPSHHDWGVSKREVYSAILYLNDDFEGGDIAFYENKDTDSEIKTIYKPESGMLIYFPGTEDYVHEVFPVKSGERGNLVIFFEGIVEKDRADQVKNRD